VVEAMPSPHAIFFDFVCSVFPACHFLHVGGALAGQCEASCCPTIFNRTETCDSAVKRLGFSPKVPATILFLKVINDGTKKQKESWQR
jgi:hypothetical protein